MRTLAILGVALLSATAFLGVGVQMGCGDSGTSTGGKKTSSKNTGGSSTTKGTGGSTNTTSSDEKGGSEETGGSDNGGSSVSSTGTGGSETPDTTSQSELVLNDDGSYANGDYTGYLWTAKDSVASSIEPPCTDRETGSDCFKKDTGVCVTGFAAKIPKLDDAGYDYDNVWGVEIGWNLSPEDGTTASVDDKTTINLGLSGEKLPPNGNARVQFEVVDGDKSVYYCSDIKLDSETHQGSVKIADLTIGCWSGGKHTPWASGAQVKSLQVQVVSSTGKQIDLDFCITKMSIE